MTTTCLLAWAAILLTLPVLLLLWATESREQRVQRFAREGMSQRVIAERMGITRYAVRKALG
jgi:DNA-binding NarL/FixJ family response regulator